MLPGNHGNGFRVELVWSFKFKTNLINFLFFGGGGAGADVVCLIIMLYNRQYLKEVSVQY